MTNKGELDFEVKDWSKIRYMVKCHWGVEVGSKYPDPVIHEYYYENFEDMEQFVQWYTLENGSISKKILMITEVARMFNVETYEVATKVRVV